MPRIHMPRPNMKLMAEHQSNELARQMDIVERLRRPVMLHSNAEQTNAERQEAAARIERLEGLLNAKTTPGYELLGATIEKLSAQIDAKDARIERLEAALRSVVASEAHYDLEPRGYIVPDQVMQWARAALAGKEE